MASSRRLARRTAAALLGVLLALCAAEVLLRAVLPTRDGWYIWPPGLDIALEPDPDALAGITGPARFRTNALGLRGPARDPLALTWLALGGSTTECLYLDEEESWSVLLERQWNEAGATPPVQILNGGRSGRDMREHVLQLEHLELELDAVLLLAGVNDFLQRLAADDDYDPDDLERNPDHYLAEAFAVRPRGFSPEVPWWKELALVRGAVLLRDRLDPDPRRLTQDPRAHVYRTWRASRATSAQLLDELPDLSSALAEYRANLHRAADLCAARGWRLALLTQPSLWREEMPAEEEKRLWLGWIGEGQGAPDADYYSAAALARGMEEFNAELRAVGAERGLLVVDLAATVPPDAAFFVDGIHVNEAGARAEAEAAAAGLLPWLDE